VYIDDHHGHGCPPAARTVGALELLERGPTLVMSVPRCAAEINAGLFVPDNNHCHRTRWGVLTEMSHIMKK
jgi:hypothetical protein